MTKTSELTDDTTICDTLSPSSQFEIKGRAENLDLYGLKTRVYTGEECRQRYEELFGKKGTYDLNAAGVVDGKKKFGRIFIENLRSRERERESTSAEYLFRLIGHEHDLGDGTNLGQFEVNGEGKYKRILLYRL